jgi:exonuclease VII small subunit
VCNFVASLCVIYLFDTIYWFPSFHFFLLFSFMWHKHRRLLRSLVVSWQIFSASASASGKEQFLSQFEQIISSLQSTRSRLESRIAADQGKRDSISQSYQELIERQHLYHRVIEKFRKECTRHEILTNNFTLLQQQQQDQSAIWEGMRVKIHHVDQKQRNKLLLLMLEKRFMLTSTSWS